MSEEKKKTKSELVPPKIDARITDAPILALSEYRLASRKRVLFTKELATQHLQLPTFVAERPLRDLHVEYLIGAAKRGEFHGEWVQLSEAMCIYDGIVRRLNGQHTCWMRQYLPDDWDCTVELLRYEVDTPEEFRRLYASHDRGGVRTNAHVANARLFGTEDFAGCSQDELRLIVQGFTAWTGTAGKKKVSMDEIADLLAREHNKTAKLVHRVLNHCKVYPGGEGAHLRRAALIGAMFMTVQKNFESSLNFWKQVADGLGATSKDDPPFRLRDFVLKNPRGREKGTAQVSVTQEDLLRVAISAWNHWRKEEKMKQIRFLETRPAAK